MRFGLTHKDSQDIGFALACLACRAIHFREFKEWIYHVIEHDDDPPGYLFDMLDIKQLVDFKPVQIMGWHSSTTISDEEAEVLTGISVRRGITSFEDTISREDAIAKRRTNAAFVEQVKQFFPFLELDEVVGPDPDQGW